MSSAGRAVALAAELLLGVALLTLTGSPLAAGILFLVVAAMLVEVNTGKEGLVRVTRYELSGYWGGADIFGYSDYPIVPHHSEANPRYQERADLIVERHPGAVVLVLGCAAGYTVQALREQGVNAFGGDVSQYIIDRAPTDVAPFLSRIDVRSIAQVRGLVRRLSPALIFTEDLLECLTDAEALALDTEAKKRNRDVWHFVSSHVVGCQDPETGDVLPCPYNTAGRLPQPPKYGVLLRTIGEWRGLLGPGSRVVSHRGAG